MPQFEEAPQPGVLRRRIRARPLAPLLVMYIRGGGVILCAFLSLLAGRLSPEPRTLIRCPEMLRSAIGASVRFRFLLLAVASADTVLAVAWAPRMHSHGLPESLPLGVQIQTQAAGLSAPD